MNSPSSPIRRPGLHHVTALASDPARNVVFYRDVLGMRLVKRTVNFDAPTVHHLYFGDARGGPGSLLTFFAFPDARPGRSGVGQATRVALAVPRGTLGFWEERLRGAGLEGFARGEGRLRLDDPDGLALELVAAADPGAGPEVWSGGPVPADRSVRGIHRVTLRVREVGPTEEVLRLLGLGDDPVELEFEAAPEGTEGSMSTGCVHHVAFRAADEGEQREVRSALLDHGLRVTPVLDRRYFRSIYFREPGGVLFEVATDGPGMDRDEDPSELGSALRLPPWLEERRTEIEEALPPLEPSTG